MIESHLVVYLVSHPLKITAQTPGLYKKRGSGPMAHLLIGVDAGLAGPYHVVAPEVHRVQQRLGLGIRAGTLAQHPGGSMRCRWCSGIGACEAGA